MEFIVFCIGTFIISSALDMLNIIGISKDLADEGYKLIPRNLCSSISNEDSSKKCKLSSLIDYIPFVNILHSMFKMVQYNIGNSSIVDQFRLYGLIEEMTEKDKKKYLKNPTRLNAFNILLESEVGNVDVEKIYYEENRAREVSKYYPKENFSSNTKDSNLVEEEKSLYSLYEKERLENLKDQLLNIKGCKTLEKNKVYQKKK